MALDTSLDREALVSSVLHGYGVPLDGPLPITALRDRALGGPDNQDHASGTSHMSEAREILEDNGWALNTNSLYEKKTKAGTEHISFTLYTADTPDLKQAAELVQKTWRELGVAVEVKVFEPSDLYQNIIRPRKYDALLFGEQIGKDRDLYAFWHSSQRNAPGLNVALYTNSKADSLLDEIRKENKADILSEKYAEFEEIIRSDIPAIFLFSPDFIYVMPKTVHNVSLNSVALPSDRFNTIGDWYAATEKVWKLFDTHN
jgi:peptide/nickel transport system substrate-binding protein